jgi:hypothetical protein
VGKQQRKVSMPPPERIDGQALAVDLFKRGLLSRQAAYPWGWGTHDMAEDRIDA